MQVLLWLSLEYLLVCPFAQYGSECIPAACPSFLKPDAADWWSSKALAIVMQKESPGGATAMKFKCPCSLQSMLEHSSASAVFLLE